MFFLFPKKKPSRGQARDQGLDTTDVRLLKLGCGSMSFAAVRNHTTATDSRPDEARRSARRSTRRSDCGGATLGEKAKSRLLGGLYRWGIERILDIFVKNEVVSCLFDVEHSPRWNVLGILQL